MNIDTKVMQQTSGKDWSMYQGDCVQVMEGLPDNSIDLSIFSPPFSQLFVYSATEKDMGNSQDDAEFFEHYEFAIKELYRVTRPGRLCVVHCSDLPIHKFKTGKMGMKDFSGEIIRAHEKHGWMYHSRVTIWKDPVVEMYRTKAVGLLHKQVKKDATVCRQGMPDYLIVFRKWSIEDAIPVPMDKPIGSDYIGTNPPIDSIDDISNSISVWQRYASPVWFDIDQTNVLNFRIAKGNQDEKHICPLQLDVIARSIDLWTNEGDVVLSPFAGIGSEGVEAIRMNRKFVGIELKAEYFDYATKYLEEAEKHANRKTLFEFAGIELDGAIIMNDKYDHMGLQQLLMEIKRLHMPSLSHSYEGWQCMYEDGSTKYFNADTLEDAIRQALRAYDEIEKAPSI